MTAKEKVKIREWLKERQEIYEKYAKELDAVQSPENQDIWLVVEDGCTKPITKSRVMETDAARSLISNYCYYRGAAEAIYGFGILNV